MNRRYFLMGSATAVAALRPKAVASANDTVRIAICGLRGRGGSHIRAWTVLPNVDLVAVCDVDQNVIGSRLRAIESAGKKPPAVYGDVRKLLEDKSIDAISIATPNHWHTLQTVWACQAGKHVYVEKPCSHNMYESQQIVAAAKKYKRIVQMGNQLRSSPSLREAVQNLREGVVGDLYMARGLCYKWRNSIGKAPVEPVPAGVDYDMWTGPAPKREFTRNRFHYTWHWFWDTGNGEIGNQAIHEIDLCRWGLGVSYPTKISAMGGKYLWDDDQETPNTLNVAWEFEQGGKKKLITFDIRPWYTNDEAGIKGPVNFDAGLPASPNARPPRPPSQEALQYVVGNLFFGSKGYLTVAGYDKYRTYLGPQEEPGPHAQSDGNHWGNFLDAVRSGKESDLNSPVVDGAISCALVHLGNISYRLGRSISFDAKTMTCPGDKEANVLFRSEYREPFVVPEKV